MSANIPDQWKDLLSGITFAHLGTVMKDGSPQVTPVWFEYTDGKLRINSARGRVKDHNMRRNSAVALSISDPKNPYRHLSMRGRVTKITEDGADAHIDKLAKKYLNQDSYPYRQPGEVRVIYDVDITSVSGMG